MVPAHCKTAIVVGLKIFTFSALRLLVGNRKGIWCAKISFSSRQRLSLEAVDTWSNLQKNRLAKQKLEVVVGLEIC